MRGIKLSVKIFSEMFNIVVQIYLGCRDGSFARKTEENKQSCLT